MCTTVMNMTGLEENRCTGCGTCLNVCTRGAISMHRDQEGFLFSIVDDESLLTYAQTG